MVSQPVYEIHNPSDDMFFHSSFLILPCNSFRTTWHPNKVRETTRLIQFSEILVYKE